MSAGQAYIFIVIYKPVFQLIIYEDRIVCGVCQDMFSSYLFLRILFYSPQIVYFLLSLYYKREDLFFHLSCMYYCTFYSTFPCLGGFQSLAINVHLSFHIPVFWLQFSQHALWIDLFIHCNISGDMLLSIQHGKSEFSIPNWKSGKEHKQTLNTSKLCRNPQL